MALHDLPRKLTYDDYVLIPEDGQRHEILDGEHSVSPAPRTRHQLISARLTGRFEPFVRERRLGWVLAAPTDVVLSPYDVVQPDLLFISGERQGIVTEENIQGAPDLIIEIFSKKTRQQDEGTKRKSYEHYGVREYWMLDPDQRSAQLYRRIGNRLRLLAELSAAAGDVLTTPLLPGLEIRLAEIFES